MKISDFRLTKGATTARAEARVEWEDSARPPLTLHFEVDGPGREDLAPEPEAFFTACLVHAAHHGERRILVEGALCPRLAEGAVAAIDLLRRWYGSFGRIEIEAAQGPRTLRPRSPARSALFLTGGVDSLHLLGTNRERFDADHPESFVDCLSVQGHLGAGSDRSPWGARMLIFLETMASESGLSLISIRTNLWDLDPDLEILSDESLSSAIASTAHLFPGRWNSVTIASGRDIAREIPRGTHPLLDPLYSSSAVEIRHPASPVTRFERLRALAGFRPGLESLVVCMAYPEPPYLNCGRCEKCVRTMACLAALELSPRAKQFPPGDVRPEAIRAIDIGPHEEAYWNDALPSLRANGRRDLAAAVEEKLEEYRRAEAWHRESGWKGRLRRFDRRILGGRLQRLRRALGSNSRP